MCNLFINLKTAKQNNNEEEIRILEGKITEKYINLIPYLTNKIAYQLNATYLYDEFLSVANLIFLKCIRNFKPEQNFKFSSFLGKALFFSYKKMYENELKIDKNKEIYIRRKNNLTEISLLKESLEELNKENREIIINYFGINCKKKGSRKIAKLLKIPRNQIVRKIEEAISELKEILDEKRV
jgi:DNA-directed RNA polymerase specialized sigma subunit